jgi:hypothetical protein
MISDCDCCEECDDMAKPKGSKERTDENREKVRALAAQNANAEKELDKKEKQIAKTEREVKAVESVKDAVIKDTKAHFSKPRKIATDLGSSAAAQIWVEGVNLGARALAEWSEKEEGERGFWRNNVDIMQSAPHVVLGSLIYALELATRKDQPDGAAKPIIPTSTREFFSDMAKTITNLGFSNLSRALRFRYYESVDERVEKSEAIKAASEELERLKSDNEKQKALIAELQKRIPPQSGATP